MSKEIIDRLFESLQELEESVVGAKIILSGKESVPEELLARIESYSDILDKQKGIIDDLYIAHHAGDWDRVQRSIGLVNGLSALIKDDAKEILQGFVENDDDFTDEEEKISIC